jgi:23S rRNA (uracil1939-C5)-methyltransferase
MRSIIPSPLPYAYRNRVTVHAENGVIGYFQRDSNRLIDVEHCPIAMEEVNRELADLRSHDVPDGHYTLRARSGPRVFSQTNDGVANALRDLIVQLMPSNQELLVDAFCGAGFFAKALVGKFQRIVGIDWDRFAIAAAKENATEKETYIAGDIEAELSRTDLTALSGQVADGKTDGSAKAAVIVDPPAVGLSARLRKTIVDLAPATLIYVSCNPATLARDLAELHSRFKIESVTPLDMFPQTAEIEVVAQLQRSNASTN